MARAFPEVIDTLLAFSADVVLDAELVVADEQGRSDFEELRRRALLQRPRLIDVAARHTPASLVVFDVLCANGEDVRELPLRERKRWLQGNVTRCLTCASSTTCPAISSRVALHRALIQRPVRVSR